MSNHTGGFKAVRDALEIIATDFCMGEDCRAISTKGICEEAQKALAILDALEKAVPEYRDGFANEITQQKAKILNEFMNGESDE